MSDDLLRQDLTQLARRAEIDAAGTIAPPEAIVSRAKRRRRNHRILEGGLAALVVVGAVSGVTALTNGSSGKQNVAVSGGEHQALNRRAGHSTTQPLIVTPTVPGIRGAKMTKGRSATGATVCKVTSDPVTSSATANQRGPLRTGASSVSADWLPNTPINGACTPTVTNASASTAAALVKDLQTAKGVNGMMSCTTATPATGRMDLVFRYKTGRPLAVVTVTLGSCPTAILPNHQERLASSLKLSALHEPGWATGALLRNKG